MSDDTESVKVCSRCTFACSYDTAYLHFHRSKSRKDGYNGWCKACLKEWRDANKDHIKQKHKEHYAENKDYYLQKNYEWRRNNPEKRRAADRKYRRAHREERNAYNRELRKRKPEVFAELAKRYYDRKQALPDNFTEDDWKFCLGYWDYSCAVCGDTPDTLHTDHWLPVSYEMADHPGTQAHNIVPLCHSCNSSKFNKDGFFWLVDLYGKVQVREIYGKIQVYFDLVRERDTEYENHNVTDVQGRFGQEYHCNTSGNRTSHQGQPGSAD